jgi:glutamate 5-kinase
MKNPVRLRNFKNTIFKLIELGALPVINENDSVATEECSVGDNDTLAALVAKSADADLLVLLSDIDGLYTADPHRQSDAKLISQVDKITAKIEALAAGAGSKLGTGGMATKIKAAKIATKAGVEMVIANGAAPSVLYSIVEGELVGTRFTVKK